MSALDMPAEEPEDPAKKADEEHAKQLENIRTVITAEKMRLLKLFKQAKAGDWDPLFDEARLFNREWQVRNVVTYAYETRPANPKKAKRLTDAAKKYRTAHYKAEQLRITSLFRKAQEGDTDPLFQEAKRYVDAYDHGKGKKADLIKGRRLYEAAAKYGDERAFYNLALLHKFYKNGLRVAHQNIFELAQQAAEHGYARGYLLMADCATYGNDTPQDYGAALDYLKMAQDQGVNIKESYYNLIDAISNNFRAIDKKQSTAPSSIAPLISESARLATEENVEMLQEAIDIRPSL